MGTRQDSMRYATPAGIAGFGAGDVPYLGEMAGGVDTAGSAAGVWPTLRYQHWVQHKRGGASMAIRILTVDDHPLIRNGIAAMLEVEPDLQVVGEAGDADSGIEQFRQLLPDITLVDLQMPGKNGIEMIRTLRNEFPAARTVVLTTYKGDANAREAIAAGAYGYLLKNALRGELIDAIRKVAQGKRCVSAEVSEEIAQHIGEQELTSREVTILAALARGWENKRIASEMGISVETVKSHLTRVFEKIAAGNRTEAIHIALRRGLVRIDD
ncbi:MAG TPA: response regulator transcription factor [Stenotrophomonas sp.]|jgi:DNA-binding NarL/FixJ family response regulator